MSCVAKERSRKGTASPCLRSQGLNYAQRPADGLIREQSHCHQLRPCLLLCFCSLPSKHREILVAEQSSDFSGCRCSVEQSYDFSACRRTAPGQLREWERRLPGCVALAQVLPRAEFMLKAQNEVVLYWTRGN